MMSYHLCSCGQHPKTFLPALGHQASSDAKGTCYACGQAWPCEATWKRHYGEVEHDGERGGST